MPVVLDSAGRRRSPATIPVYHAGRPPPTRACATPPIRRRSRRSSPSCACWRGPPRMPAGRHDRVLWRGGLLVQEALALAEHDLDLRRDRSWLVTEREGGDARSAWTSGGWGSCAPGSPHAPSCRLGRCSASSTASPAGDRGRAPRCAASFAASPHGQPFGVAPPHQLRHAHALELAREAFRLTSSSANSVTPTAARRRSNSKASIQRRIIATVRARRAPMMSSQRRAATLSDRVASRSAPARPLRPDRSRCLRVHSRRSRAPSVALAMGVPAQTPALDPAL